MPNNTTLVYTIILRDLTLHKVILCDMHMLLKSIGLGRAVRDPRAPSQTHGHAHVLYVLYPRAAKQHVYPARGRANIFCIVPSLTDDPRRESDGLYVLYDTYTRGNTCGNMCALQNTLWHHVRDLSLSLTHTHTHTHTRTGTLHNSKRATNR